MHLELDILNNRYAHLYNTLYAASNSIDIDIAM